MLMGQSSYCRAMMRFGMKPCEKKFWLKICVCSSCFIKRRGARVARAHPFVLPILFLYFENIIRPFKRTTRCRNWVTLPPAGKIYCWLTRYSSVFMVNRPHKSYRYNVLASKDTTMTEIRLFWIKPHWLWCLQATFKHIFHLS